MIGIVGGMGPLAGLDVFKKIIEETTAQKDQDHPSVLLFSLPSTLPDRTEFLLGREKTNPAYAIAEILRKLEEAGATVAGIPCNTAHAPEIFGVISEELAARESQLQLVHLIEETTAFVKENFPGRRIGVLSTTGTRRTGLYKNALEQAGLEVIEPGDSWQERIHATVYSEEYGIKANCCPVKEKAVSELKLAIAELKKLGADVILMGCTEIPLAITESEIHALPIVDANRVLARKLIAGEKPIS